MLLSDATLRRLDAFALAMRENARGGAGGLRRSRALGSSVEFSDFRSYAPGDDLRRVDWNAFARFDRLFLKLFLDEQETTLHILLDASASMRYGEPDKWPLALRLAAMLAYLSLMRYDRVSILTLQGEQVARSRRFAGRAAYAEVEAALEAIQPAGQTRLDAALVKAPLASGHGVCVLISDLLTDAGWQKGVSSLLYRRQEVSLLQLLAPQEMEPDFSGALQLLDSEGEEACEVEVSADTLRRYRAALAEFLRETRAFCHARGVAYLLLQSDMAIEGEALKSLAGAGILQPR